MRPLRFCFLCRVDSGPSATPTQRAPIERLSEEAIWMRAPHRPFEGFGKQVAERHGSIDVIVDRAHQLLGIVEPAKLSIWA